MDEQLTIALKTYLDEKFSNIDRRFESVECQIKKLDVKLDTEHDKIISAGKDTEFIQDEVKDIQTSLKSCKENCERRKDDFNRRVDDRIKDKISISTNKTEIWIYRAITAVLITAVSFLTVNFFMMPVKEHIQPAKAEVKK